MRPMAESRRVSSNSSLTNCCSCAPVAEELLERPGQAPVAVREVGAQHVLDGARGLLVDRRGLGDELLELAAHDVHVHRRRGVLEREQADAQRALHHGRAVRGLALGERRGQHPVREDEALDDDAIAVDADLRAPRRCVRAAASPASGGGGFGLP